MKKILLLMLAVLCISIPLVADSALEFDGIDNYVQLSQLLNIGSTSSTIEAWIKVPVVGSGNLIADQRVGIVLGNWGVTDDLNNVAIEIYSAGQIRYYWHNGEYDLRGTTDIRDGSWHHLAAVRDKSNNKIIIYIDGVLEIENIGCGSDISIINNHKIGIDNRTWSEGIPYFHGAIDELRVWNTARTQPQIREYMCEDVTGQSGLISYYKMSNDSGTSLTDNTGNGNTGTLMNMDNSNWVRNNQTPAGDGSTTPYQINGLNQLYWLSQNSANWSSDFEQVTDIIATATESWDGGAGFTPIGNNTINFMGSYIGNDHIVYGLNIDRGSTRNMALFGRTHSSSEIFNLHLRNVNIAGWIGTGALVSTNYGNISQCSSTGNVSSNNSDIGGLISANVGTVAECFSTVTVNTPGSTVGGLIGYNGAIVRDCYANGDVSGNSSVGGLIGSASNGTTTINSYSTGSVVGSSSVGGFVGYAAEYDEEMMMPAATITNCFWDSEASGNATSAAGTGKTTAEMKTLSTYTDAGWDFTDETVNGSNDYWGINNAQHDGYPFLSWEDYTHNYSDTPLPVTLSIFNASCDQGAVTLTWSTESETQNLGFMLERKTAGSDWKMIANYLNDAALAGHGTTSETHDYNFTDSDVIAGQTYQYRLSDVSENNEITELKILSITIEPSDVLSPSVFGICKAYPNPFNPVLSIKYDLIEDAKTTISILNLAGQTVTVLENGFQKSGSYELQWQADAFPSGIYFVELISGSKKDFMKVLLTK